VKRLLLVLLVVAALPPATASAAPEDPPVQSVLPADGAVLPVNADGIEVRYTCPEPYRSAGESPFITYGDRKDYGVDFATRPSSVATAGLLQSNVVALSGPDQVQDNDIPTGPVPRLHGDPSAKPQAKPGTYYWQAWRSCLSCPGGNETSAVRSFRLTAAGSGARLAVAPPARAYRGFPFVASVPRRGSTSVRDGRGPAEARRVVEDDQPHRTRTVAPARRRSSCRGA
jgi:hypothetical protein